MASDTFSIGDITAVIGDNSAQDNHRAGYNGLWSLTHKAEKTNVFVPTVAGLNLEHIFDGETLDPKGETKIFFEPRNAAMTLKKLSATEAELHQPPTPTFHLESWTTFKLVEPHYVDFAFRFRATQHAFKRGYIGLFWASYINAPDDKSMYLRGKSGWLQHCTPAHDTLSTVLHEKDTFEMTFSKVHRDCLYRNFSPLRYELPFFYGLFRDMTLMVMLDRTEGVRWSHDGTALLLLCRRPGARVNAFELWLYRLDVPGRAAVPVVRGLTWGGVSAYGLAPSLFTHTAWSRALATAPR